jgi:superfamily I DNA/RNA helicase
VQYVMNLALHSGEIEEHTEGHGTDAEIKKVDQGKVTLTTIHSCKGLEWPVVFAVKWQQGVLKTRYNGKDDSVAFSCDDVELARFDITPCS